MISLAWNRIRSLSLVERTIRVEEIAIKKPASPTHIPAVQHPAQSRIGPPALPARLNGRCIHSGPLNHGFRRRELRFSADQVCRTHGEIDASDAAEILFISHGD